jgi:murein DD-endopeptidase MepM/ murein hydrolase activator NlpD
MMCTTSACVRRVLPLRRQRVQGPEPKTPIDAAQQLEEGERPVVTDPSETPSSETPRAASTSRTIGEAEKDRGARKWRNLPLPTRVALAVAGGAAALLGTAIAPFALSRGSSAVSVPLVHAALVAALVAASQIVFDSGSDAPAEAATPQTSTWRVSQMGGVSGVSIVEAPLAHRSLQNALVGARLAREEAERVTRSLASVRNVDHLDQKDVLTLAIDSASLHVVAYELSSSPTEVWQGREQSLPDGTTKLEARRLDLVAQRVRVGKSVVVGPDLRASFAEAGLGSTEDLLSMLDDALDGHAELSDIRPGARLRLVATQDQVDGEFVRWVSLDAVEYFPASGNARPVRVYSLADSDSGREAAKRGFYDAKGRQPVRGGWRSPVPFARIASRFNPHRMHPVLHVIMPHNGVDFAAPNGAPVYATAAGTVTSVGNDGPCGNKVEIAHAAGISSVYCHLSRFAPGLRVGTRVEQRQLIAYVGQTGRVTGPHLHFGIRRNGVFVDPMTLRLDGVRVVPHAQREEFERHRVRLDGELDEIPLPAAGSAPPEVNEPETFYEEP